MELLRELEIPQYIRRVRLANARRAEYYELGKKKIKAKKFLDQSKYEFKPHKVVRNGALTNVYFLTDLATGARVIKNPVSAGTPKDKLINGQDIYNQTIVQESRNRMLQAIKASFAPFVNTLEPIDRDDLPVRIEVELHDTILESSSKQLWDVDNRFYMYGKAFQDVLTGNKLKGVARSKIILPDDNCLVISKPPSPLFIPVQTPEERKLIFRIYKEDDPRILNSVFRQALFNKRV
jgi:hypothetical protein